jgi:hypothetical protein
LWLKPNDDNLLRNELGDKRQIEDAFAQFCSQRIDFHNIIKRLWPVGEDPATAGEQLDQHAKKDWDYSFHVLL